MHDVAVVGAGPAGCYVAGLLARRGLDVHVFEEHETIGDPVDCSGVVGTDVFTTLGTGSSFQLGEIRSLLFVSPSGLELSFKTESPLAYVVDRGAFDRDIASRLCASGVAFHLRSTVMGIQDFPDRVDLSVTERPGAGSQRPVTVRSRMAILACGPKYRFQRSLGMGEPRRFLRTAQTEVLTSDNRQTKIFLGREVAEGSFAWLVPFKRHERQFARVGVSSVRPAAPLLQELLQRLHAEGYVPSPRADVRSWVIPISPLRRTYAPRILAVGDAAGQTKPTTGGGIYYALLCAEAAAATALSAFDKGDFSESVMKTYHASWRKRLGREIRVGNYFRSLVERLDDSDIDRLFRVVQSDGILAGIERCARFDWHRDVIYFVLRHPELGRIFLRRLFH